MSRVNYRLLKRLALSGTVFGGAALVAVWSYPRIMEKRRHSRIGPRPLYAKELEQRAMSNHLPTREEQLRSLKEEEFDILVVGAGATGCGVALDAVSRGLKTALVEKFDFSSGTSSRSTKLIHGGVRYLQKAIFGLDYEQYRMVREALAERANLIDIAPHLAYPLPIMLPVYRWWQVPYYWAGIKAYDLVSGRQLLKPSYFLSKMKALELFPMLKRDKLVGAIVYYDGQHNDARMCIAIALTATRLGATVANRMEVVKLLKKKDEAGKEVVCGATVRDELLGTEWDVRAKCVVNATGAYTDTLRCMDQNENRKICQPSSGVHIVLPDYYSPAKMGLLDPATSDGRVIFFLPWENNTMAGTTDNKCELTDNPTPTEAEIQFILKEIRNYLSPDVNVRRGDVLSAWCGLRPLVLNPNAKDTQSIARNHIIEVSDSNLVTIAGGKWTTYRSMAEETVDKVIEVCDLKPKSGCVTRGLLLEGAHDYSPTLFIRLIQDFGLDSEVAQHLANTYGDKAFKVAKLAQLTGQRWPIMGKRLHEEFPYIEAEIHYAIQEYACTMVDVIARRTRLAFLNVHAATEALPRILEIMSKELGWSKERQKAEMARVTRFLKLEMGLELKDESKNVPINFTKEEINLYIQRFRAMDSGNKGYITVNDLRQYFKKKGERISEDQLHEILSEVDLNRNAQVEMAEFLQKIGEKISEDHLHEILSEVDVAKNAQVEMGEFLQLMSALKTGAVSMNRFAKAAELGSEKIDVVRSGGGV